MELFISTCNGGLVDTTRNSMIQINGFLLTELEQKILIKIGEGAPSSVEQVHRKLGDVDFIGVMREIHKLHGKGYLTQTHVGSEAQYKVKPRILNQLRKSIL
jgi:hypothetical protein